MGQLIREGNMKQNWKGELCYLTFPQFSELPSILHGFSTRLGGVSEGACSTMNLSFERGDQEERVRENFRRIAAAIGFQTGDMVFSRQTHTTNIRVVTEKDRGKGFAKPMDYDDVDGLMTNVPGLVLVTFYADCVPLYFVDPVHRAVALVHSGWRGTVGKIGLRAVEMMNRFYGSKPEELTAAIGPSICSECYEVSEDVADQFAQTFGAPGTERILRSKGNKKYQLDLWTANEIVLQEAGIRREHLTTAEICTCCQHQVLFSHRATNGRRGNLAAFLGIKQETGDEQRTL